MFILMPLVIFVSFTQKAFPWNGNTVNNSSSVFQRHLCLYFLMNCWSKEEGKDLSWDSTSSTLRTTRGTDQALVSGASHLSPLQGKCRSLKINLLHTQCPALAAGNCHTWHTASGWDLTSVSTPTAGYSQDGDTTAVIFRYLFQPCHKRC